MKNKTQKIKYIILIFILIEKFIFSLNFVWAKYNYKFNLKAFSIRKISTELSYEIVKSIENGYTNQDIILTIYFNNPINLVDDFELSENKKVLTRLIKENESKIIKVKDIYGNNKDIKYSVENIDKLPPQILGIEDEKSYNSKVNINYKDNIGINNIVIKNISNGRSYNFSTNELNNLASKKYIILNKKEINPYLIVGNGIYQIIAIDIAGNQTTKKITIK